MNPAGESYLATYQAPLKNRVVPVLIAAPLSLLGIFGRAHLNTNSSVWNWIFAILGFISIAVLTLSTTSCKITLYNDRIERKTWFGRKTIRRDDIAKVRKHSWQMLMIVYKNNSGDGMVIPKGIGGDAIWNAWMANIQGHEIFAGKR